MATKDEALKKIGTIVDSIVFDLAILRTGIDNIDTIDDKLDQIADLLDDIDLIAPPIPPAKQ